MISDLFFLGFEFSNIFEPAGIVILGCFTVVFWARFYQNVLNLLKTIINFCSIWTFLSEEMGPASKINTSRLKLAPLLQALVSLYIRSDQFLTLVLFLSTTLKGWKESIGCPDEELYADTYFI